MIVRLVDCCEYECIYGYMLIKNFTIDELQDKIYEIKNQFDDDYSWCIGDVLEKFPPE